MLSDPLLANLAGVGRQTSLGKRMSLEDLSQQPYRRLSGWASTGFQSSSAASSGLPMLGATSSPSRASMPSSPSRGGLPPTPTRSVGGSPLARSVGGSPLANDGRRSTSPANSLRRTRDDVFSAAVAAEQLRLRAEFEDLYRKKAAQVETAAQEAATAFAGHSEADVMALESEILQETVLAEQLQASEEAREAQTQSRARGIGRPPKPNDNRSPELGHEDSEALRQLEQRAWRAQNAVRASEAHEDLLQAHRKDLERKLREVQAEADEVSAATSHAADEGRQLPALEEWEAGLAERVRQGSEAEIAAREATEDLQRQVLDLENECGALWLDITLAGNRRNSEASQLCASLRAALAVPEQTDGPSLSLEQLLTQLEAQREERHSDLRIASSALQIGNQEYRELLEDELRDMTNEAQTQAEQASALKAEVALGNRAMKDAEDRTSEAASLRHENDVARRQQQVWQTSQLRMLRLIEDMQRQRVRDVQSQATVAARLAELQRELPLQELSLGNGKGERTSVRSYPSSRSPSPPKSPPKSFGSPGDPNFPARGPSRLNALWSDNVALKSQIRRLEEEKDELIKSQEGLIRLVKSKMPTSEQVRDSLRSTSMHSIGGKPSLEARYPFQSHRVTA